MYKVNDKVWFILKTDLKILSTITGRELKENTDDITITQITYQSFLESTVVKKYFEIFATECKGIHLVVCETSYLLNQLVLRDIILKNKGKIKSFNAQDKIRLYLIDKLKTDWLGKVHLVQSELILRLKGFYENEEVQKVQKTQIDMYSGVLSGLESYVSVTYKKLIGGMV